MQTEEGGSRRQVRIGKFLSIYFSRSISPTKERLIEDRVKILVRGEGGNGPHQFVGNFVVNDRLYRSQFFFFNFMKIFLIL